jgi:ubiquinone/menaquinone biosynthesis C-methylase UbiE
MYLAALRSCDGFTEAIRSGRADTDVAATDPAGLWPAYAASHLARWPDDVPRYRERWAALGVTAASLPGARVLDVGCGPAVASLVLALDDPAATVTGIDRAPVTDVAAQVAAAMGLSARATFVVGDATSLAALDGPYDVVFFGHVFHFFDPAEIARTLRQAHRLLTPRGSLVIVEVLQTPGDYEDATPYTAAVWLFNVAPSGRVYTVEELAAMLTEAGFVRVRRLDGAPWIHAERGEQGDAMTDRERHQPR